jgi:hypothetical protein
MQKALALFLLLVLCCFAGQGGILYAQEDAPAYDESIPDDDEDGSQDGSDFNKYIPDMYSNGDQTITISLGTIFPAGFYNNKGVEIPHNIEPPVGWVLSLAYSRFLGSHFFLGVDLGFASAYTLGQNAVFIIPIGIRAGWQFVFRRFEFPLYATIGIAPQRYLDLGYFGMYLKGAVAAYYRFNPKWSFGISADWNWYPQWPLNEGKRTPDKDIYANIIGVLLSARYHF